ncbi:hypothetical protein D3C71_52920 [compost metagenome]
MSNRLSYIYRSVIPALALLCGGLAYGQTNTPNTTQQTVAGSVTNTVPIPASTTPWGVQTLTVLVPKYRDTASAQFTYNTTADKAAMTATALSGQGNPVQVGVRRGNNSFIIQPGDIRNLPDGYSFQPYPSAAGYDINPIYRSTQYHSSTLYPSEGGTEVSTAGLSASMVRNTSLSTERSSTTYAPGRSRIGQGRGTKTTLIYNDANTGSGLPQAGIRIWDIGSGVPVANGYYAANALKGSLITTAQGGEKIVLEDREGKPVYEASLISNSPKTYARTYYVYDEMGRLRYVLPPKAVEALEAASGVVSTAIVNELCFSYFYDGKGRQYAVHKPGENGYTELVYNKEGQVIMRRNVIEQSKGLWEVIFYDRPGRVIATAILTNNDSRDIWQDRANTEASGGTNTPNHYLWGNGRYTYPDLLSITSCEIQAYNYYDSYEATHPLASENFSTGLIQASLSTATDAETFATGGSTYGLQTSGRVRIIRGHATNTGLQDWAYSKTFYDKERRPIYTVSQHARGGKDTAMVQYSYTGQVLVTAHGQQYGNGTGPAFREWYRNTYNAQTGELSLSEHRVNNIPWQVIISNTYDDMGRKSSSTLGSNAETQNFSYNIRGELQGINENFALTGSNGGQSITFGEALRYDYGYDSLRYDGLAAGMIWRGSAGGNMGAHSYGYIYDAAGRMLSGAYSRSNAGYVMPTSWSNSSQDYSETVTYDQGGNILSLKRMAVVAVNQMVYPTTVDNLTYTYLSNSNKLDKVVDAITTNFSRGDFLNRLSQGYTYDLAGNLVKDRSKGIFSSNIGYTYFNKPFSIVDSTAQRLYYSYDAAGNKVQEIVNIGSTVRFDYISTAQYRDTLNKQPIVLLSISTPVGRIDMTKSTPQEQYFIKDHLGNVRSVVADAIGSGGIGNLAAQQQTYNATYETGNLSQEEQTFDQVAVLSEDKPESTSSTDSKAALLTTGNTSTPNVGTTLLLKVMAGDKLSLNADNYYESSETSSSNVSGSSFEQVVNSLAQAAGQLSGTEGTIASDWAAQMLNSSSLQQAYNALQNSATDPDKPKAYLSYLFFDEQMQLVPEYSRIWQADGAGNWSRIGTDVTETMDVPQNGYVATYISTQSAEPTYFDNLAVTLESGVLLEEKHYYPYGLPIVGMGSTASGMLPNKNRYQGNEYREEGFLNWMDFHNRQYDPQLGRFLSIDPMADAAGQQGLNPYHAMACNPSTMTDPLGLYVKGEAHNGGAPPDYGMEILRRFPTMPNFMARYLDFGERTARQSMAEQQIEAQEFHRKQHEEAATGTGDVRATNARFSFSILVANLSGVNTDNTQTSGDIVTYDSPYSKEELEAAAKMAGKQPYGSTSCNMYSLNFISILLKAKVDWEKMYQENETAKTSPKESENFAKHTDMQFISMGDINSIITLAKEIKNGGFGYFIEHNSNSSSSSLHRVAIVRIELNTKNPLKSSASVYDPATGSIEYRPLYFEGGGEANTANYGYYYNSYLIKK